MLSAGGEVASDAAEDLGAFEGPEAARDFLLHLSHADVVFALVVRESHERVRQETESFGFEVAEALQKVA